MNDVIAPLYRTELSDRSYHPTPGDPVSVRIGWASTSIIWNVIGQSLNTFTPIGCPNCFRHAGYAAY
jgi:hypothetical protein